MIPNTTNKKKMNEMKTSRQSIQIDDARMEQETFHTTTFGQNSQKKNVLTS